MVTFEIKLALEQAITNKNDPEVSRILGLIKVGQNDPEMSFLVSLATHAFLSVPTQQLIATKIQAASQKAAEKISVLVPEVGPQPLLTVPSFHQTSSQRLMSREASDQAQQPGAAAAATHSPTSAPTNNQ